MKWRILVISFVFIVSLWNIPLGPVGADLPPDDYNLTKYDPRADVMRLRTGGTCLFTVHNDVEITKITSRYLVPSIIPSDNQIELNMTVEGIIQMDDNYTYMFFVFADGQEYIFAYSNGMAIGFELGSDSSIPGLTAEGAGTNKLTIIFNIDNIGPPSVSYDFSGGAIYNNGDYERYFDFAPDKLLLITEPSEGSTINGLIDVRGVIRESIESRPSGSVRIKIDSGAWENVVGTDPWSYPIDTTLLSEGEHTIYVEIDGDDLENARDEITITVDQNKASYESFDNKPEMHVGDWYTYESIGNTNLGSLSLEMWYEVDVRVEAFERISEDGIEYEAFRINTNTENEQDLGYIAWRYEIDRTSWRENDNFGVVKERTITSTEIIGQSDTVTDTTTVYSPPLDHHNKSYVTVGFNNRWLFHITADSASNTTKPGETIDNPPFSESLEVTGECLYYKESHIVFNHTFDDIYLIKTYLENPGIFTIEYYSPEMGVPVQVDIYDPNRNLITSVGLRMWEQAPYSIEIDDDEDDDGLPDSWEEEHFGNLSEDGEEDFDGDGLTNNEEYNNNTNPKDEDTDGDGMPDKWEIENGLNATLNDSGLDADEDGHTNLKEYLNGTDPQDENDPPDVTEKGEDSTSFEYWWILLILILIVVIIVIVLLARKGKRSQEIPSQSLEDLDQPQEPITDEQLRSPPPSNQT